MNWRTRRQRASDEAKLVAFAERLCEAAAAIEPAPNYRTSLRTTLMAEAVAAPSNQRDDSVRQTRHRRRLALVSAVLASVLGLSGIGTASASALPGDTLYPVKLATETVTLATKQGDSARGTYQLVLANRRLGEANTLADNSAPSELSSVALDEFGERAQAGSDELLTAYRAGNSKSVLATLNRFSVKAYHALSALQAKSSGVQLSEVAEAQRQLSTIVVQSAQLCPDCAGITPSMVDAASRPLSAPTSASPTDATKPIGTLPGLASGRAASSASPTETPASKAPVTVDPPSVDDPSTPPKPTSTSTDKPALQPSDSKLGSVLKDVPSDVLSPGVPLLP